MIEYKLHGDKDWRILQEHFFVEIDIDNLFRIHLNLKFKINNVEYAMPSEKCNTAVQKELIWERLHQ